MPVVPAKISAFIIGFQARKESSQILAGISRKKYRLPGGQLETDEKGEIAESPFEAALRETKEETGVKRQRISLMSGTVIAFCVNKRGEIVDYPRSEEKDLELKLYFICTISRSGGVKQMSEELKHPGFYQSETIDRRCRPSVKKAMAMAAQVIEKEGVSTPHELNLGMLERRLKSLDIAPNVVAALVSNQQPSQAA